MIVWVSSWPNGTLSQAIHERWGESPEDPHRFHVDGATRMQTPARAMERGGGVWRFTRPNRLKSQLLVKNIYTFPSRRCREKGRWSACASKKSDIRARCIASDST